MKNEELIKGLESLINKNDHTSITSNTTISLKVIISLMGVVLLALSIFIAFRSSKFEKMEATVARVDKENIKLSEKYKAISDRVNSNYIYARTAKSDVIKAVKENGNSISEKMTIQFENVNRRLDRLENKGQRFAKLDNVPERSQTF